jgi:hypothetical protein
LTTLPAGSLELVTSPFFSPVPIITFTIMLIKSCENVE